MKNLSPQNSIFRLGFIAMLLSAAFSARANPIPLPEKPVTPEISFLIPASILLEAICWVFLLRRFRRPRFLILWILGMHLLTFPMFLGVLKFLDTLRPVTAVMLGEMLVVLVEGYFVFLICNYFHSSKRVAPSPSLVRCWLVSLAGNICSAAAFPVMAHVHDSIFNY
jgi:hypothetical protein